MSTGLVRLAFAAGGLLVPCALFAQSSSTAAPAPAAAPTPAASATPGAQSSPSAVRENPPGMTPATPPPLQYDSKGNPLPPGERQRSRRGGNFMPANPDATPVLPGGSPSGAANASGTTGDRPKGTGGGARPRPHGGGMGRAFEGYQTKEELAAYREKVRALKTVSECQALMESTRKEMEPRAKAQNKTIDVDIAKICETSKERGRLKG